MKKVIIVTGASSGIGKATALQLIDEGHTVYGVARRVEKMQDLVNAGGYAKAMDITNHEQVKTVIQEIIIEQNRIDVLVNNAGFAIWGAVEDTSYEDAKRQFEVNIFGLAEITKAVLPFMREQKNGKIINVSSIGGKIYTPLGAWYHATKHALEGWSDCLRLEIKQFGIDVSIIQPGAIRTEFGEVLDQNFSITQNSPYTSLIHIMKKVMVNANKEENSSNPSEIANTISKAIGSLNPKTRYAKGKIAAQTLFFRRYFPDKMFDNTILRMLHNVAKQ